MATVTMYTLAYKNIWVMYTLAYKNIWVTQNFNRDIIINSTDYVFIIRPIHQYYLVSSIENCRYYICFIVVKFEFTILFYNFFI